jgi:hypothetical protein
MLGAMGTDFNFEIELLKHAVTLLIALSSHFHPVTKRPTAFLKSSVLKGLKINKPWDASKRDGNTIYTVMGDKNALN